MFTGGFEKVAKGTATIVPVNLRELTGHAATMWGHPFREFAKGGRKALVDLSRIRDGLR